MPPTSWTQSLRYDLPASVVVFLVALPLCLGIALASGAPLIAGVIAGIVGGVVVGALSGSHIGVSGPAAGLAVIVYTAIRELGSYEIFLVAVVLAGLIQLVLGYARAGVIGYYFPSSVIKGMLAGIGILIILKQIPHALGHDKEPEGTIEFAHHGETTASNLMFSWEHISPGPLVITLVAMGILILWETGAIKRNKVLSLVPGPLLAVVAGVALGLGFGGSAAFALHADQLVSIPVATSFADLRGFVTFPDFAAGLTQGAVYKTAVVLAVVASLETLLCVEATDKLDPEKRVTPTNLELRAQGLGNMVSGVIGGLPVTQVIVRSSANIQAGGRTKVSAIVHGLFLLVGALVLPTVLNLIPLATLAAILLVVGYKLAKPSIFAKIYAEGWAQFLPFITTIVGIVLTDLLIGIALGLAVAVLGILYNSYRNPFELHVHGRDTVRIVLAEQVTFLHKASVLSALSEVDDGATVEIDTTRSKSIEHDVVEVIEDFEASAAGRELKLTLRGFDRHRLASKPAAPQPIDQTHTVSGAA